MRRLRSILVSLLLCGAAAIALCSLAGKAIGQPAFRSWIPDTVPMKETTAWIILIHVLAGLLITLPVRRALVVPVCLIALVTFLLAGGLINEIRHLENLGSFDPKGSFFPSFVTVGTGVLLACKALAALVFESPLPGNVISGFVVLIGTSALIGYYLHIPALYYFIPGYTTAMAMNTATAFLLLGCVPVSHALV